MTTMPTTSTTASTTSSSTRRFGRLNSAIVAVLVLVACVDANRVFQPSGFKLLILAAGLTARYLVRKLMRHLTPEAREGAQKVLTGLKVATVVAYLVF